MIERVSVMIVDDQPPFRAAARAVLARVEGFTLVAEAASGEEAVAEAHRVRPDLVLMDIHLGQLDGIAATRLLLAEHPGMKVVLMSSYDAGDLPPAARTSGAIAYVDKDQLSPRMVRHLWESGGDPRSLDAGAA